MEADQVLEKFERAYGGTRPNLRGVSKETDLSFLHFHEAHHPGRAGTAVPGPPGRVIEPSDAPEGS